MFKDKQLKKYDFASKLGKEHFDPQNKPRIKNIMKALNQTYVLSIMLTKYLFDQHVYDFFHVNQNYEVLWKIQHKKIAHMNRVQVIDHDKLFILYENEEAQSRYQDGSKQMKMIVELYDLKKQYSFQRIQLNPFMLSCCYVALDVHYFLTKNKKQICFFQQVGDSYKQKLYCWKLNFFPLELICQHCIVYDQAIDELKFFQMENGLMILPESRSQDKKIIANKYSAQNSHQEDNISNKNLCCLNIQILTCEGQKFQNTKKQYTFSFYQGQYLQFLPYFNFMFAQKNESELVFCMRYKSKWKYLFYNINLNEDKKQLAYIGGYVFQLKQCQSQTQWYYTHLRLNRNSIFYCFDDNVIALFSGYQMDGDLIHDHLYLIHLKKESANTFLKEMKKQFIEKTKRIHNTYEIRKNTYILDLVEFKKFNSQTCEYSQWKFVSLKNNYLHFLLHINEDFDDDLLSEAIYLLQ